VKFISASTEEQYKPVCNNAKPTSLLVCLTSHNMHNPRAIYHGSITAALLRQNPESMRRFCMRMMTTTKHTGVHTEFNLGEEDGHRRSTARPL
jgi:hypothetical protein